MGLFGKRMKDPVKGTAQVVSASLPPRATHGNCHMQLVVQAEGVAAYPLDHHAWVVPVDRWPWGGDTIPVTVDRANPEKIHIDWDEVPSTRDESAAQADAIAARLRGETPEEPGAGAPDGATDGLVGQLEQMFPGATVEVRQGSSADLPPGTLEQMEQALGMDLDGDGRVGPAQRAGPADEGQDDRIARLERLAALHASGALSDAEFDAEKRRIIGAP